MPAVSLSQNKNIAVITIDNPPVNAISQVVRQGLIENIKECESNDDIEAVIIHCAGRTFMAGADIKEFGKPPVEPHLPDVINSIEQSAKPVVAAIHGMALGGGLEVALGAHYRVLDKAAKVGLPEVNLGLLPGAGGTQRLPRLIGIEAALDIIASGKPINAEKAKSLGIADMVSDDLLNDALDFANTISGNSIDDRRLCNKPVNILSDDFFDQKRTEFSRRRRGFEAPQAIVAAMEAASNLSFQDGLKRERELFERCRASTQSIAQQHLFFAERTSLKIDDIDKTVPTRNIKTIAIIGAGTMGIGIAICFASTGFNVILLELKQDSLDTGLKKIEKIYESNVQKGRLSVEGKTACLNAISGTTNYDDLSEVDMVIEAAFEKMDVKESIFKELSRVTKDDCILATNTSFLDVNKIASFTNHPENVLGLHFFSPANIMKLLEIVRCDETAPDVLQTAMKITKKIGKVGVVSGVCHGFIGNRMYQAYQREAGLLIVEGATPTQVDKVIKEFGMPIGPFAVGDLTGLDIGCHMRAALDKSQYEEKAFTVHSKLVEQNRLGQKSGAGFYDYPNGPRKGEPSELVEQIIMETSEELGFIRRDITDQEIVERCIYAIVNEGARILEEGIAQRSSDIDVVYCNGYGFPRWRGGPMKYAEINGSKNVAAAIDGYSKTVGPRWWTASNWFKDKT
ncbi:MAG: 3-hydroxyacyl-CoA dehydrogenase NAD-binding domain-containing protein [Emcibacteraceae bacterium]|nr:3-hydroxyacyl-CoA dehydrogenase NAD-binding domain-containing protein [Emcibacteraceae bacterium]MDG1996191.1 3-hydroxyacyl-CoA dehydrogenase NAD-binding domain-containing protein [Emcibacteraceae bacterium]